MVKGYEKFTPSRQAAGAGRPTLPPAFDRRWPKLLSAKWIIPLMLVAVVVLAFNATPGLRSITPANLGVPDMVDAGTAGGFLSRIFNIKIEYDDKLDEKAKLQMSRGKALLQAGECMDAILYFDDVLEVFPRNGDALFFRAQSLYRVGLFERAAEDVEAVLRRYPDDIESLVLHADLTSQLGRDEEARASLKRAERLSPSSSYARRAMARAYRQIGEWQKSVKLLERLLQDNPRDAATCYEMALLLAQSTDPAIRDAVSALQYARRALRESPDNWAYGEAAALALAADSRLNEAIRLQERVVDAAPKWAWKSCAERLDLYRRSARKQAATSDTQPTSHTSTSRSSDVR